MNIGGSFGGERYTLLPVGVSLGASAGLLQGAASDGPDMRPEKAKEQDTQLLSPAHYQSWHSSAGGTLEAVLLVGVRPPIAGAWRGFVVEPSLPSGVVKENPEQSCTGPFFCLPSVLNPRF